MQIRKVIKEEAMAINKCTILIQEKKEAYHSKNILDNVTILMQNKYL